MAPSRAAKHKSSTSTAGPSKQRPYKTPKNNAYFDKPRRSTQEDTLPGVQKLKAALRQTKRLLAKDNLAADLRVETERRSKALEIDIARAEKSRKERQYATKYHKVKFFERQKVVRKINQMKRCIAMCEEKEKRQLESALFDLRVDLNYVLHFPKTKKYVSLFPPEVRGLGSTTAPVAAPSDDNEKRSQERERIRRQMERGELSTEPENELGGPRHEISQSLSGRTGSDVPSSSKHRTHTDDVASDDFFGEDDGVESQRSEASDF